MNRRFNSNLNVSKFQKEPPGVYRLSRLGQTLREAVDELGKEEKLSAFLQSHIMTVFDQTVSQALDDMATRRSRANPLYFTGKKDDEHCFIDGSWEIHLTDVTFYDLAPGERSKKVDKVTICAENWTDKSVQQRKIIKGLLK